MTLRVRPWRDDDYWPARDLLRRALVANDRRMRAWHVARLDYWWWFGNPDLEHLDTTSHMAVWETPDGRVAALVNPEHEGEAFLAVDPAYRSPALDAAMVDVAEALLAVERDGRRRLRVWADARDRAMGELLGSRGYERNTAPGEAEVMHRRDLRASPLPPVPSIPGYEVRPMRDGLEVLERAYASGLGFHEDDIAVARDNRDNPAWLHHIMEAPLYRRDLDIVAVAADGAVGSFCTAWFDDVTRTAQLEPVATVPAHRRRGLARAAILEAMHRLAQRGCEIVFVSGYSDRANALYLDVMGPDLDVLEPWERTV